MIRDTSAQDQLIEVHPKRRRLVLIGIGVAVIVVIGLLVPSLKHMLSASSSVSASRLSFATVQRGAFVNDIAADGRVVAAVRPTLYANSPGMVALKVHAGDTVKRGQVLATIDSPELKNKLAQEKSNLDAMEVDYERAKIDARKQRGQLEQNVETARIDVQSADRDFKRYQEAFKNGAFTRSDVDHAKDSLEKAQIKLKHAQSDLSLNRDSLGFDVKAKKLAHDRQALLVQDLERRVGELNVRSPVNGQIGQLFVAPRATVAKDAKLLSVIDLSALEVEVKVPESFARDLGVGMPARISGNGNAWNGQVSAISPEVVNGEVAARVRFEGAKPEHLRQNQRLSVRIVLDKRDNVLTVARGSFVDESGGRYAYVVHDGIAVKTPIRVGASSIDKVEILQGLKVGDKVVISGTDNFNGAARVAISD
ncbi:MULTISPECIES: HlyD family efflux transporter periplasmic adaptor subunit [Oleiagrimonas]|uniref:HlyD family efflux transporter periplasmic adaptor subunit n=1 Tax=Oleiagrimonas citrea TaxID=1665687 RepID=A0A846ZJ05_9GAMM|nr:MULTISPECIES: HlyD family efflux transporter periplasmic adaptor subunit [Oleiagrimonas]NKZ38174.1 HlyD family efflux transporter periplasmic adaptor subunit [Oleiagrimonas citrea]RAP58510.1 efflux transporter periplasmic adaptor subunit [Oleiagrimonas sp. MCCC 1A03011]